MDNLIYNMDTKEIESDIGEIREFDLSKYIEPMFYDREEFHIYHSKFAESVFKVIFKKGKKYIAYFYGGIRNNIFTIPYSAPFSMIYTKDKCKISSLCEIVKSIIEVGKYLRVKSIKITLPPEIYNKECINSIYSALNNNKFRVKTIDLNNYFDLNEYSNLEKYLLSVDRKTRQNYNRGIVNGLKFTKIENNDFNISYDVIKRSKEELNYPLKISEQQMKDIINMDSSNVDCFIVKKDEENIAAAIAFKVTNKISQVIYVGDIIKYRNLRPTELLYIGLIRFFKEQGNEYIDFGPSGEDGIINIGLADYKNSMGCNNISKFSFEYIIE